SAAHDARDRSLDERERALNARAHAFEQRVAEVTAREQASARQAAELSARERELEAREAGVVERADEIERREQDRPPAPATGRVGGLSAGASELALLPIPRERLAEAFRQVDFGAPVELLGDPRHVDGARLQFAGPQRLSARLDLRSRHLLEQGEHLRGGRG